MRVEMSRVFPAPLKQGYDYLMDWRMIPGYRAGVIEIVNPQTTAWSKTGDSMRLAYRVLGRRIESDCTLNEVREGEMTSFTARTPGLPTVRETWRYAPEGEDSFSVTVVQETGEASSFFGKVIDRTLLARVVEKDLARSLDNLEDIFSVGVPE